MRTNIYKALSFDRLHAYHLGIFLHVLKIMKLIVEKLSRKAQTLIDDWSVNLQPCVYVSKPPSSASIRFPLGLT